MPARPDESRSADNEAGTASRAAGSHGAPADAATAPPFGPRDAPLQLRALAQRPHGTGLVGGLLSAAPKSLPSTQPGRVGIPLRSRHHSPSSLEQDGTAGSNSGPWGPEFEAREEQEAPLLQAAASRMSH